MKDILDRYTADIGRHFDQTPGPVVLPAGTAPGAGNNWLGVPGTPTPISFTVNNDDFDAIDLMQVSNGPFLVTITAKYRDVSNGPVHSNTVFGTTPGLPFRLFIPIRLEVNDILQFTLQDISAVANNLVYITVRGVQLSNAR